MSGQKLLFYIEKTALNKNVLILY